MSRPDTTRLRGSIVPLVTPFHDGRLDEDALRRLVEFQIRHGSHGISVLGTTGEPTSRNASTDSSPSSRGTKRNRSSARG